MGLRETLQKDKLAAMKAKEGAKVSALTAVMTKVIVAEKSGNYELPLSDEIIQTLIQKEISEIQDSMSFYKMFDTHYQIMNKQIEILKTYLPQPYTELEVESMIVGYITATEETNAGKITGAIAKMVGTRFDKKLIKGIVERVLKA
jgi:uncharacterized protein YqeY